MAVRSDSRLLTLPNEVREQIYEYLLGGLMPIKPPPHFIKPQAAYELCLLDDRESTHLPLSLLLFNRQLQEECRELVLQNMIGRFKTAISH